MNLNSSSKSVLNTEPLQLWDESRHGGDEFTLCESENSYRTGAAVFSDYLLVMLSDYSVLPHS